MQNMFLTPLPNGSFSGTLVDPPLSRLAKIDSTVFCRQSNVDRAKNAPQLSNIQYEDDNWNDSSRRGV